VAAFGMRERMLKILSQGIRISTLVPVALKRVASQIQVVVANRIDLLSKFK